MKICLKLLCESTLEKPSFLNEMFTLKRYKNFSRGRMKLLKVCSMYTEARAFERTNSRGRTTSKTFFNDANVKSWRFLRFTLKFLIAWVALEKPSFLIATFTLKDSEKFSRALMKLWKVYRKCVSLRFFKFTNSY